MKEMKLKRKIDTQKGITLIALIITIIVLLILAMVAIRAVTGEGILNHASESVIKHENGQVNEALQLAAYNLKIENAQKNSPMKTIDYLKGKQIIDENNVINVEKLVGRKLSTGNGTFETKKDIYVLEQQEPGETANVARLASTKIVKIAQTDNLNQTIYDLVYYNKKGDRNVIGNITDTKEQEMITFTIGADETLQYTVVKGTTWYEFCQTVERLSCNDVDGVVLYKWRDGIAETEVCLFDEYVYRIK